MGKLGNAVVEGKLGTTDGVMTIDYGYGIAKKLGDDWNDRWEVKAARPLYQQGEDIYLVRVTLREKSG